LRIPGLPCGVVWAGPAGFWLASGSGRRDSACQQVVGMDAGRLQDPVGVGSVDSVEKGPASLVPEYDDRRELLAGPQGIDVCGAHPGPGHARGVGDRAEGYLDQPVCGCLRVESFFPEGVLQVRITVKVDEGVRDRAGIEHPFCQGHGCERSRLEPSRSTRLQPESGRGAGRASGPARRTAAERTALWQPSPGQDRWAGGSWVAVVFRCGWR
jgi:hypothetical protein